MTTSPHNHQLSHSHADLAKRIISNSSSKDKITTESKSKWVMLEDTGKLVKKMVKKGLEEKGLLDGLAGDDPPPASGGDTQTGPVAPPTPPDVNSSAGGDNPATPPAGSSAPAPTGGSDSSSAAPPPGSPSDSASADSASAAATTDTSVSDSASAASASQASDASSVDPSSSLPSGSASSVSGAPETSAVSATSSSNGDSSSAVVEVTSTSFADASQTPASMTDSARLASGTAGNNNGDSGGGPSTGAIVGGVVGGLAALALVAWFAMWVFKKKANKGSGHSHDEPDDFFDDPSNHGGTAGGHSGSFRSIGAGDNRGNFRRNSVPLGDGEEFDDGNGSAWNGGGSTGHAGNNREMFEVNGGGGGLATPGPYRGFGPPPPSAAFPNSPAGWGGQHAPPSSYGGSVSPSQAGGAGLSRQNTAGYLPGMAQDNRLNWDKPRPPSIIERHVRGHTPGAPSSVSGFGGYGAGAPVPTFQPGQLVNYPPGHPYAGYPGGHQAQFSYASQPGYGGYPGYGYPGAGYSQGANLDRSNTVSTATSGGGLSASSRSQRNQNPFGDRGLSGVQENEYEYEHDAEIAQAYQNHQNYPGIVFQGDSQDPSRSGTPSDPNVQQIQYPARGSGMSGGVVRSSSSEYVKAGSGDHKAYSAEIGVIPGGGDGSGSAGHGYSYDQPVVGGRQGGMDRGDRGQRALSVRNGGLDDEDMGAAYGGVAH